MSPSFLSVFCHAGLLSRQMVPVFIGGRLLFLVQALWVISTFESQVSAYLDPHRDSFFAFLFLFLVEPTRL